jgi:hypothetical protein
MQYLTIRLQARDFYEEILQIKHENLVRNNFKRALEDISLTKIHMQ